jgi:hypothetical protein
LDVVLIIQKYRVSLHNRLAEPRQAALGRPAVPLASRLGRFARMGRAELGRFELEVFFLFLSVLLILKYVLIFVIS